MRNNRLVKLDFDELKQLHQSNPEAFEDLRSQIINEHLDGYQGNEESTRKLRGLQFKIDMERRRQRPAMGNCVKMSSMMWDKFYQEFHPALMALRSK